MARFQTGSYHVFNDYQTVREHYFSVTPYKSGTKLGTMAQGLTPKEVETLRPASSSQRRRKHQMMYLRENDEAIVFKMYRTNVLAFTPQNTIEVGVHTSTTTSAYLNELLPQGVSVQCTGSPPNYATMDRVYHVPENYRFTLKRTDTGTWEPIDAQQYVPIKDISIDLPKYYAAIKHYKFKELEDFVKAAEALRSSEGNFKHVRRSSWWNSRVNIPDVEDFRDSLSGPEGWHALYVEHRENTLEVARQCILAYVQPFHVLYRDSIPSKSYTSVLRRAKEYKWALMENARERAQSAMSQNKDKT